MKICRRCSAEFTPTERQLRCSDYICVPCSSEHERQRRLRRKEEGRPVRTGQMPPDYHKAYDASYSKRPEVLKRRSELARLRTRNPVERLKIDCRRKTRFAIEKGSLVRQPCEVCGDIHVEAHHDDYSRPFVVRWLCRLHHREYHAKARGEAA